MAYGRVNVNTSSKNKIITYKGLSSIGDKIDGYTIKHIDFSKERKIMVTLGSNRPAIFSFYNTLIAEFEDTFDKYHPAGFLQLDHGDKVYDIVTGTKTDLSRLFSGRYINLEGDYIRHNSPYIYYKDGSIKHNLKHENNKRYYITDNAYYFYNTDKKGYVLYKYSNRKLEIIEELVLPDDLAKTMSVDSNSLELIRGNATFKD